MSTGSAPAHCHACGKQAPLAEVVFYQKIGMLLARQQKFLKGSVCQECAKETFKKFTLTTLTLGWWVIHSFFITPFFLINNVVRYLMSQRQFSKR